MLEHPIFQNVENYSATIRLAIKSNPGAKYISMVSKKYLHFWKIDLRPLNGVRNRIKKKTGFIKILGDLAENRAINILALEESWAAKKAIFAQICDT